ncbi:ATP-binding protein [Cognatazoarcus halotolerans]|uniref:ATP-binding protein n=1 Tax=Cognatazoarcus halotolerans TaxID=2686016 RepID=UPI00135A6162|nr:ATP-binding protein [Cognatazoarcus halotolerans]MCB1902359.1 ATP-binding protein [Rhodocyclaceae bacterium]MCP5309673.1 ATP-binding protein [Zoogloeaceae bacterium]
MSKPSDLSALLERAHAVLEKLEQLLPGPAEAPDWKASTAFRWRRRNGRAELIPIEKPHRIRLSDLKDIDDQKSRIDRNTRQFLAGKRANNALLTGARGTGKSSLVKALLTAYAKKGLRLIEVDKTDLVDLPEIVELIQDRPERFIIFCDDLSFEEGEAAYKALKSVLDGSVSAMSDNLLIYATSNRRHLMPEYMAENLQARHVDGEVHPGEAVEEKISLSERFGLWISFYPFSQEEYLSVVEHWLKVFGAPKNSLDRARAEALQWALMRGSRSGRVAWQFARDHAGRFEE